MYPVVMTTSTDRNVMLWNAETGECEGSLTGHAGPVHSASITPCFRWLVTASEDKTAKVWSVMTGNCLVTLIGHERAVLSAAFSPNFILIVTGSADFSARIWSFDGDCKQVLLGHMCSVLSASFTEDSMSVVTFSDDSTRKVWSVRNGKCANTVHQGAKSVHVSSYSPDGKYFVIAPTRNVAHICIAGTGECQHRLVGHEGCITSACFAKAWVVPEKPQSRSSPKHSRSKAASHSPRHHQHLHNRSRHGYGRKQGIGQRGRVWSSLDALQHHSQSAKYGSGHPYNSHKPHHHTSQYNPLLSQSTPALPTLPSLGKSLFTYGSSEAALANANVRSSGRTFAGRTLRKRSMDQPFRIYLESRFM